CLASNAGDGKTRFIMDLARRVYFGEPWPDGKPAKFPEGSKTLWVAADNHHAELATVCKDCGIPRDAICINSTCEAPFGATTLAARDGLKAFEARIRRVQPALVRYSAPRPVVLGRNGPDVIQKGGGAASATGFGRGTGSGVDPGCDAAGSSGGLH